MKSSVRIAAAALSLFISTSALSSAQAATVLVDLSEASTGTTVTGVGASFAQGFSTGPLALDPSGTITVASFNPEVSAQSNSLLSQPNNSAPLAILFDGGVFANSLSFTWGSWNGGAIDAIGYDLAGNVTGSKSFSPAGGYSLATLSGIGNFAGVLFTNNSDPAGLRFQNFSYETVATGAVPEPATWAMFILGFGLIGFSIRRRKRATANLSFA